MTNKSLIFAGIFAAILGNNAFATGENTVTSKSYVDAQDALKQDKITSKTTGNVVTYNGTDANGQTQFDERAIFDYETSGEWDENNQYQFSEGREGDLVTAIDVIPDITNINWYMDSTLGEENTVVIRNGRGQPFDSRNIYDGSVAYDSSEDADSLITAGAVQGQIDASVTNMNNQITNINNQLNGQTLESISVQLPLTCANSCEGLSGKNRSICEAAAGAPGGCTLWTIGNVGVAHKLTSCTTATVATDCPACGTGTVAACENDICKCNACKVDGTQASSESECCSGNSGYRSGDDGICCGTPGSGFQCTQK